MLGSLCLPCMTLIRHCIKLYMRPRTSGTSMAILKEVEAFNLVVHGQTTHGQAETDLYELVQYTRGLHASDPRDAIYAIIGLADGAAQQALVPNYEIPATELYARVSKLLVEREPARSYYSLTVLTSSQRLILSQPSWIIDFSRPSKHKADWSSGHGHYSPHHYCLLSQCALVHSWGCSKVSPHPLDAFESMVIV
jgi:hypothetical protein